MVGSGHLPLTGNKVVDEWAERGGAMIAGEHGSLDDLVVAAMISHSGDKVAVLDLGVKVNRRGVPQPRFAPEHRVVSTKPNEQR